MTILFILWALGVFCMFPVVLFRVFCLFKKKCSWQKCPYPFDEEEEKELDETIRELTEMIEQLCGVQTHTNELTEKKKYSNPR